MGFVVGEEAVGLEGCWDWDGDCCSRNWRSEGSRSERGSSWARSQDSQPMVLGYGRADGLSAR